MKEKVAVTLTSVTSAIGLSQESNRRGLVRRAENRWRAVLSSPVSGTYPLAPFLTGRGNGDGSLDWTYKRAGWRYPINESVYQ